MIEELTVEQCWLADKLCKSFKSMASMLGDFGILYDEELVFWDEHLYVLDARGRIKRELPATIEGEQLLAYIIEESVGLNSLHAALEELR